MVAAGILWGTIGPSVEQVQRGSDLTFVDVSFWRAIIASAALGVFALVVTRDRLPRLTRRNLGLGLLCGASTAVSQLCFFAALGEMGIGPATLVSLGLGPLLVALGEAVFLGRRPGRRLLVVVAVSVVGMVLLVSGAGSTAPEDGDVLLGLALSCGCATTYAAVVLLSGSASNALGVVGINLLVFVGIAVSLGPVVAIVGLDAPADGETLAWTLYLGLVASALAYGLYFLAARSLGSTVISIIALLEPLTAAILAWIAFDQALSALGIAGGALMLGAVVALSGVDDLAAGAAVGTAVPETREAR
jgi:drug/metabolite transporter, DME family